MKRLIVNADDFGLTQGVNRAVAELHQAGVLTSTTLMANGAAFEDAVTLAKQHPQLGVGCHIVLVDGSPTAVPNDVRSLVDGNKSSRRFRSSLAGFAADLYRDKIREADIEREAIAQIRKLQQAGMSVTHIDTHKHTHMFSAVLRPLLRAARACGVLAIRNPFEPGWSVRATNAAPVLRRFQVKALRTLERQWKQEVARTGLATTDGALGVLATGTLDSDVVASILDALPQGRWELVCHPGYNDEALRRESTRLLASRVVEMDALHTIAKGVATGIELESFRDLHPSATESIHTVRSEEPAR